MQSVSCPRKPRLLESLGKLAGTFGWGLLHVCLSVASLGMTEAEASDCQAQTDTTREQFMRLYDSADAVFIGRPTAYAEDLGEWPAVWRTEPRNFSKVIKLTEIEYERVLVLVSLKAAGEIVGSEVGVLKFHVGDESRPRRKSFRLVRPKGGVWRDTERGPDQGKIVYVLYHVMKYRGEAIYPLNLNDTIRLQRAGAKMDFSWGSCDGFTFVAGSEMETKIRDWTGFSAPNEHGVQ